MLTVAQALAKILDQAVPLPPHLLPLEDTLGRRLAQPVIAKESQPPFAASAMDGYALGALEPQAELIGEVAAGHAPDFALHPGQCARIFTGAMIPEGTVAVVPQEETEKEGRLIRFKEAVEPLQHIRPAGEHFEIGQTLLQQNRILSSADLGLAGLLGYPQLFVQPRPKVTILTSGDELVELDQPLMSAQVRNSNVYALQAQVHAAGGVATRHPILPDDPTRIKEALQEAAQDADLLITCGGASVGDRDYMQQVLADLGADLQLWKVAMRPGKPLGYARLNDKPVIALPGNPVSCYVGFELFVRPLLDRMQGGPGQGLRSIQAVLGQPVTKKVGLRFFMRCRLDHGQVFLAGAQASHLFRSVPESDGLLELEEEIHALDVGAKVGVLLWPWAGI